MVMVSKCKGFITPNVILFAVSFCDGCKQDGNRANTITIAKHEQALRSQLATPIYINNRYDVQIEIYFCNDQQFSFKEKGIVRYSNKMISGIYYKQLEKIEKLILSLHEELQFDYTEALRKLKY